MQDKGCNSGLFEDLLIFKQPEGILKEDDALIFEEGSEYMV